MTTMKAEPPAPPDEQWTLAELSAARSALADEISRLRRSVSMAETEFGRENVSAIFQSGDDLADIGSHFEGADADCLRATNSSTILTQCEMAIERIAQMRYGTCDSCGHPVGKARLQAIPRATHCLTCQQSELHDSRS